MRTYTQEEVEEIVRKALKEVQAVNENEENAEIREEYIRRIKVFCPGAKDTFLSKKSIDELRQIAEQFEKITKICGQTPRQMFIAHIPIGLKTAIKRNSPLIIVAGVALAIAIAGYLLR